MEHFLLILDKIHTTELGLERIRQNFSLDSEDVVVLCRAQITAPEIIITKKGKNWYIHANKCIMTVNAHSYTIITAHLAKE